MCILLSSKCKCPRQRVISLSPLCPPLIYKLVLLLFFPSVPIMQSYVSLSLFVCYLFHILCLLKADVEVLPVNGTGAAFLPSGHLYVTHGFGHLRVSYNTTDIRHRITLLQKLTSALSVLRVSGSDPEALALRMELTVLQVHCNASTASTVALLTSILDHHIHSPTSLSPGQLHIQKRQVLLGALAGVVGGFIYDLFQPQTIDDVLQQRQNVIATQVQLNIRNISSNSREVSMLRKATRRITKLLVANNFGYDQLRTEIQRTYTVLSIYQRELRDITAALRRAARGRVDILDLDSESLARSVDHLTQIASARGFLPISNQLYDLDQLPSSYVVTDSAIHIVVHVSLYRPETQFALYHLFTSPILTNLLDTPVYVRFADPHYRWFATAMDGTSYLVLTDADLESCHRDRSAVYCPHAVRRKVSSPSCMYALWDGSDIDAIRTNCHAFLSRSALEVTRIDSSRFLITHPADALKITCPRGARRVPINGTFVVHMASGCLASTRLIAIDRDMYEYTGDMAGLFHSTPLSRHTLDHLLVSIPNSTLNLSSILSDHPMPIHKIQSLIDFDKRLHDIDISHSPFHIPFLARLKTLIIHGLIVIAISILCYFGVRLLIACVGTWRRHSSPTSSRTAHIPMGHTNSASASASTQQLNQAGDRPFHVQ